jgi:hypothetical protein
MELILIEARRLAIGMSITDFAGTTSWCESFMRRNDLCICTKITVAQTLLGEYESETIVKFFKKNVALAMYEMEVKMTFYIMEGNLRTVYL